MSEAFQGINKALLKESDSTVGAQMPRYQSHKQVYALKINALEIHEDKSATIAPEDKGYGVFKTRAGWGERFEGNEKDRGYYVVYDDGFTSWSPTKAFEEGYSRI